MKNYTILFLVWMGIALGFSPLVAQDTTALCGNKKTFVIRKKEINTVPNNHSIEVVEDKKIESNLSLIENSDKSDSKRKLTHVVKMPTLAGGEFGLMDIRPYKKGMDLQNWKYVALQYSVTVHGWATKVEILETNDDRLKDFVLKELKKAQWNPAIDADGNIVEHRMHSQVVIVKDQIYEEDYYNRY